LRLPACIVSGLFVLVPYAPSAAMADLQQQASALNMIADFANRICTAIPLEGNTTESDVHGKLSMEVSGLLKKLATAGIEGGAKYQSTEFQGLLQKDLVGALRDSTNCKLRVWADLKDKLLPSATTASAAVQLTPAHPARKFQLAKYVNTGAARIAGSLNVAISVRELSGTNTAPLEAAIRRALDNRGYSVIPLFREAFQRDGLAQQLLDGDPSIANRLKLQQYCDAVLLGVVRFVGPAQAVAGGMYIREAVLDIHEIDPLSGHLGPALEIREKGGGTNERLSTENALDRLENEVATSLREWSWT
jgi:hypothetical protein